MSPSLEETVVQYLKSGYLCSESVIKAAAEQMGITWDRLPAIATGLGGGIGGTAGTCGALTGATLALGLVNGRNTPDQDYYACVGLVEGLVEGFKNRFGSIACGDILGVDISTEEGRNYAVAQGIHNLPCKDCCVFVARYLTENTPASR